MSYKTRCNITLTVIIVFYSLLFAIMALGYFFPEPTLWRAPWYAWAAIAEVIVMGITVMTIIIISQKMDEKRKKESEE